MLGSSDNCEEIDVICERCREGTEEDCEALGGGLKAGRTSLMMMVSGRVGEVALFVYIGDIAGGGEVATFA